MKHAAPTAAFEVRREASRRLGYREEQVLALYSEGAKPTYGELQKALDFYDRAGAYRSVVRLRKRGLLGGA